MTTDLALSPVESSALAEHEAIITRGLKTFADVGNALLAIRDGKLYRQEHGTFEAYCREKWGFNASRARQLIGAAEVVGNIQSVTTVTLPTSERQARPLTRLAPSEQAEAWTAATGHAEAENRTVTAADVEEQVEKRKPATPIKRLFTVMTKAEYEKGSKAVSDYKQSLVMSMPFRSAWDQFFREVNIAVESGFSETGKGAIERCISEAQLVIDRK